MDSSTTAIAIMDKVVCSTRVNPRYLFTFLVYAICIDSINKQYIIDTSIV